MSQECNGLFPLRWQDFVIGLSVLLRGSVTEKLRWAFNLYDINKDGYITKEARSAKNVPALYETRGSRRAFPLGLLPLTCVSSTLQEMLAIMTSVYDMMGRYTLPSVREDSPYEHVEKFFQVPHTRQPLDLCKFVSSTENLKTFPCPAQKMDRNRDGVVTIDEFIETCQKVTNCLADTDQFPRPLHPLTSVFFPGQDESIMASMQLFENVI